MNNLGVDVDGGASNGNDTIEVVVAAADGLTRADGPVSTTVYKGEYQWEAYQEFPGTPITVIGLQVTPTITLRSWRTMPSKPRRTEVAGSDALVVSLQHWMGPVSQVGAGAGVVGSPPPPVGTAMAAAARARVVRRVNCMLKRKIVEIIRLWRAVVSEDLKSLPLS
jgi:hypothetical protein